MEKLIRGLHHFQQNLFSGQKELFERLASGQAPEAMLITCSDSRIDPALITQTEPGEIFVLRNAGNIVPPHGVPGGEAATIEYAVAVLHIKDIIVCGHSHCGAMEALHHPEELFDKPTIQNWLTHAEAARRTVTECYPNLQGDRRLSATVEENVLTQIENLRTHPSVAAALAAGTLHLHAWVYKFETGQVFSFDPAEGQFVLLSKPTPVVCN